MPYAIPKPPPIKNGIYHAYRQGLPRDIVGRLLSGQFRKADYRLYLATNHWHAKKAEALEFWGRACCLCDANLGLHVHHRPSGYKNLFKEDVKRHLVVVCSRCHRHHHRK